MNEINRFIDAQKDDYFKALNEIENGNKETHWMWYIFPQIKGLGQSSISKFYEIKDLDEAKTYLNNEIIGKRLIEISNALLKLKTNDPIEIFGEIDSMKLKSSMTLFDYVSDSDNIFSLVIKKYFNGQKDENTINICKRMK